MATRNLTKRFVDLRTSLIRSGKKSSTTARKTHETGDAPLLTGVGSSESDSVHLDISTLAPEWVDIVEEIQRDIVKIKEQSKILRKKHDDRLKVNFGDNDESEQEKEIEIMTDMITKLMKKCENNLKRIASVGNAKTLTQQEKTVRLNIMRSLGTELQQMSKQFRNSQKDYCLRLKDQESGFDSIFGAQQDTDSKETLSFQEGLDRGFTESQLQQLEQMQRDASQRDVEIIRIAQSVNELAQIFRELSVLVIEQGTILDRIDYHIEEAKQKVKAGVVELEKADEYSKKSRTMKCILCMILLVIVLSAVLGWKVSKKNQD